MRTDGGGRRRRLVPVSSKITGGRSGRKNYIRNYCAKKSKILIDVIGDSWAKEKFEEGKIGEAPRDDVAICFYFTRFGFISC